MATPRCEIFADERHDADPPEAVVRVAMTWWPPGGEPQVSEKDLCGSCYAAKLREFVEKRDGAIDLIREYD